ncbi:MAG: hypothetical protein R3C32_05700 [Chloroflexota bacterium]
MIQIFLLLAKPSILSAVVFTAWYSWNQFLGPLAYRRSRTMLRALVALVLFEDPPCPSASRHETMGRSGPTAGRA